MLTTKRSQRTLARATEVRGVGFFHGADVTVKFHPAQPDTRSRFRPIRPAGKPHGPGPGRLCGSVAAPDDHPAWPGAGRDDRARDGRSGRIANRQLPDRDRRRRMPRAATAPASPSSRPSNRLGSSTRSRPRKALWSSDPSRSGKETPSWPPIPARETTSPCRIILTMAPDR